ncbi:MAG: DUF447 family protein [Methanosarcinales archaeon]|nr:DUF447 family protein [Methanosarcinales archaeon]
MSVSDVDIIGEGVNETIVTTVSKDGVPNAAPIGIIRRDEKEESASQRSDIFVKLFPGTTCQNVIDTGYLVANITYDPMHFVMAALGGISNEDFERMGCETALDNCAAVNDVEDTCNIDTCVPAFTRLKGCTCILFECERLTDGTEPEVFSLKPVSTVIEKQVPIPVNRGFNAIIEACVAATRFVLFEDDEYLDIIKNSRILVNKCGSKHDLDAFELLLQKIGVEL